MQTTLQDLLHAINLLGDDRDVFVDGIDSIAVCPPVNFTPAGREHFKKALAANVEVHYDSYGHEDTYVSDADEDTNVKAWELLAALAGYCDSDGYGQWFEGDTATLI